MRFSNFVLYIKLNIKMAGLVGIRKTTFLVEYLISLLFKSATNVQRKNLHSFFNRNVAGLLNRVPNQCPVEKWLISSQLGTLVGHPVKCVDPK